MTCRVPKSGPTERRTPILRQVLMVLVSACISLCLPGVLGVLSGDGPALSSMLGQERVSLAMTQFAAAVCLILLLALLRQGRRDRALAEKARTAGMVVARGLPPAPDRPRPGAERRVVRDIMLIGATGMSFSLEEGELAAALRECREARIMLLDPREHGALARSRSIPDPEISLQVIREQVLGSIECLRGIRRTGTSVLLKLYPDLPLFKLAIMDGTVSVRHYHTALNVRLMPEYVFEDTGCHGGLYLPLYRYFLSRWQDPDIPAYDFDTDELVYRDQLGAEVLREPFSSVSLVERALGQAEGDARPGYIFRSDDIGDARKEGGLIPSEI